MNVKSIQYSRLTQEHLPSITKLLMSHGITLAGLSGYHFLSRIMKDAAITGNPNVVIATTSSDGIIGWSIAIRNSRHYWKRFLLSHPMYIIKILLARATALLRSLESVPVSSRPAKVTDLFWRNRSSIAWGQSNPHVARHVDITVLEQFRQLGVASGLYLEQFKALTTDSVTRIDACIRSNNTPSQRFHIKEGWSLVKIEHGWIYVTKSLSEENL
jgi:hypothetical protein